MKIEKILEPSFGENMYILVDEETKKCAVVDPGGAEDKILNYIKNNGLTLEYILLTHGHGDHIGAVKSIREKTGAKVVAHTDEKELLNDNRKNLSCMMPHCGPQELDADIYVNDKEKLTLGNLKLSFIHTPGHTKGGMCIRVNDDMFTGDTLFAGSIGRTDFIGGSYKELEKSLKKLSKYENDVKIHPGHGPSSTLGIEKTSNPYMSR
ncbi:MULTISPECIES: MBL fold metallo-hydrolase [Romboutsia]|uniref:Metallo-beta-lactamase n=1 Tax=Romboutsia hominis TaxID=1507512 RepID=A0A2P2BUA5_9FIRM|nr:MULTISPECIES: MBL fold metallo-hydrolase [Romboutsia]MCH1961195.1 MBL fold metallo-hydrolase [Romboutsia hominis]MCH1968376.1 MBL fold metallo-hydrolase [Romboutsia hominis]MDB8789623.1 MBL fold metallo-hydrolase [Romboutsia sp. 1001216sp1]MDB8802776.1 MBL fold metallo-hydrolase [Romboutsia sp. 1001216sp1]MDB8805587.1 MBL fold metallo-hydrolase [Romboutsia sp. 1001216sp1]